MHVVNRASLRAKLFQTPEDYDLFVGLLSRSVRRFQLPLLGYCVMPTHWHLVVGSVTNSNLSRCMQWLTSMHAQLWCEAHPRRGPGPVYQGRFRSVPVQPGINLYRVLRYVERNASKADLSALAEDWPWGSARQRLQNCDGPELLPLELLPQAEWLRYLNEPTASDDIARAIRLNLPVGDEAWVRQRAKSLGLAERRRPGRPCKDQVKTGV